MICKQVISIIKNQYGSLKSCFSSIRFVIINENQASHQKELNRTRIKNRRFFKNNYIQSKKNIRITKGDPQSRSKALMKLNYYFLVAVVQNSAIEKGLKIIEAIKARQVNKDSRNPDFPIITELAIRALDNSFFCYLCCLSLINRSAT